MLIDDVTIKVQAGKGGKGGVYFNSNLMSLGPTGARGGNGGNVYVEGVSDLGALRQFRYKKKFLPKMVKTERKIKRRDSWRRHDFESSDRNSAS